MTGEVLIQKALLRRAASELLFFYAQQMGFSRYSHGSKIPTQIDRLEGVLREIDGVLKKGAT
jgi:hypothetical protein